MKYLSFLFLIFTFQSFGQQLSPQAKVSLLTISPAEELYSTFGHSAIRITDPVQGIDQNFNYGTFDFDTPGFYMKFLRGYLNYQISSYPAYLEIDYWNKGNRLVTEQILNLTPSQKQKMFDFLKENLKPENKEYRYKFFTDNCSTRLRDVLNATCGDSLKWNEELNADSTFREWIDKYANNNHQEWADFWMDLAIGTGSDQKTGWADAMFIPDNLMVALDQAKIVTPNGVIPIVISKGNLNRIEPKPGRTIVPPSLFFAIFMLVVSFYTGFQYRSVKKSITFDRIFFSILGIAGWIILALWFLTDHGVTENNQNIIWASPLLFPATWFLGKKAWAAKLFMLYAILFVPLYIYFQFLSAYKFSNSVLYLSFVVLMRLVYLFKAGYIGFNTGKRAVN